MLELKNIYKTYRTKNGVTHRALNNVSINFDDKGLVFIVGKSGSGKSTLLNVLGALDGYERGDVIIDGKSFNSFTNQEKDAYRNTVIGFVFQEYNLIDTLTVKENLNLALSLQHIEDDNRIKEVIDKLDLKELERRKPHELSGGQQQRVSIARALIKNPKIILADEPTGSLDSKTGAEIFNILKDLSKEKLVIVITHDRENAEKIGDRVIEIKDGIIYKDLVKIDEVIEQHNIDVIGSSVIRIPKEKAIDDETVDKINDIVLHNGKDNYIIFEQDSTKVKSMFPPLRGAIKDETKKDITNFVPYRKPTEEQQSQNIQYVKSSLPLKSGFKISLNNLKYKKVRLSFTIIMMIFALTIMGIISALNNYDYARALNKTIQKESIPNIIINQESEFENQNEFSQKDLENLKSVYSGPISYYYSKEFNPYNGNYVIGESFLGYAEIDSLDDLGLTAQYGVNTLEDYNSIIITDYMASKLIISNVANNEEELINKTITCEGKELKIVGILKTDYHKYDILDTPLTEFSEYSKRNKLENYFILDKKYSLSLAYVKKGYLENVPYIANSVKVNMNDGANAIFSSYFYKQGKISDDDIKYFYEKGEDDIIVSIEFINYLSSLNDGKTYKNGEITEADNIEIKALIDDFNNNKTNVEFYAKNLQVLSYINVNGKVIGYINNIGYLNAIIISDTAYQAISNKENAIFNVILKVSLKSKENIKLFNYVLDNEMNFQSYYQNNFETLQQFISELSKVLSGINIFVTLLVIILFFSFIISSIKLNKKKIGVIRALGARQIDTFKIFAWEGAIISIFSLIVSFIILSIMIPIINTTASKSSLMYITYIVSTPKSVLSMILLTILITILSISLPLRRFSKLKPMDAITDK